MSDHHMGSEVSVPELASTGERFVTKDIAHHIQVAYEHLHRYLFSLDLCRGKDALDIASGEGYGSNLLAQVANRVVGVDISAEAVRFATGKYKRENLRFVKGDCLKIPLPNKSVDVVVSFETIEHISQHERFLQEIKRVLRADGILVISSPDKHEYSDRTGRTNPFHVTELYKADFLKLVKRHFKNCLPFQQRLVAGSYLAADQAGTTPIIYGTHRGSLQSGTFNEGVNEGVYAVAVCSNSEIPSLSAGIFENRFESERIWDWYEQGDRFRKELSDARNLVNEQAKQIERLQSLRNFLEIPPAAARQKDEVANPEGDTVVHADGAVDNQASEQPQAATASVNQENLERFNKQLEVWEEVRERLNDEIRSRDATISEILKDKERLVRELTQESRLLQDRLAEKEKALNHASTEVVSGLQKDLDAQRSSAEKLSQENKALQEKNQELNKEVVVRGEWGMKLNAEIAKLRESVAELHNAKSASEENAKSAADKLQAEKSRSASLEATLAEKEIELQKAREHASQSKTLLESTQKQFSASDAEQVRLLEIIQTLSDRRTSGDPTAWPASAIANDQMLRKEIDSLTEQVAVLAIETKKAEALSAETSELQKRLTQLSSEHEDLKLQKIAVSDRLEKVALENSRLVSENEAHAERVRQQQSDLARLAGEKSESEGKLANVSADVEKLQLTLQSLREHLAESEGRVAALSEQLTASALAMETERNQHSEDYSRAQGLVMERETEINRLNDALESLSATHTAFEKQLQETSEELLNERSSREVEAVEHRLALDNMRTQRDVHLTRYEEAEKQIIAAQTLLNDVMRQSEQTLRWGASLDTEIKTLRQVLEERDRALEEQRERVLRMGLESEQAQGRLSSLTEELETARARIAQIEGALNSALVQRDALTSEFEAAKRTLGEQLAAAKERESVLESEVSRARSDLRHSEDHSIEAQATLNRVLHEAELAVQRARDLDAEHAVLNMRIKAMDTACENKERWVAELEAKILRINADREVEVSALRGGVSERDQMISRLGEESKNLGLEIDRLLDKVRRMQSSVSWKVTSPLRLARRTFFD